jgi:hypothetical protein
MFGHAHALLEIDGREPGSHFKDPRAAPPAGTLR